jgi:hypothetical protein
LDETQFVDLKDLIEVLISAAEFADKHYSGRLSEDDKPFWGKYNATTERVRYSLGEVGQSAFWFIYDLLRDSEELKAVIKRDNADYLLNALANALVSPRETYCLTAMATHDGTERARMPAIIKAGEDLSNMREIDPELGVAGPGIEAYYTRYFWGGLKDDLEAVDGVLAVLEKARG